MAEKKIRICDICKIQHVVGENRYWGQEMGKIVLSFQSMPSIQATRTIDDCCYDCGERIYRACMEAISPPESTTAQEPA